MAAPNEVQAKEIQQLCEEAGMSWEQMAEAAGIKSESMRKIYNGYQPCSAQLLQSFRNVAQMQELRLILNREFARLFEESGWTMEKAARELDLKVADIKGYLNGTSRPDPVVVKMFKLHLGDMSPFPESNPSNFLIVSNSPALLPLESWETDLLKSIRIIEPKHRRKLITLLKGFADLIASKSKDAG